MPSILEQLGIDTQISGKTNSTQMPEQTMTEATQPKSQEGIESLAEILVAGAVLALEQAINLYGVTSQQGKELIDVLRKLMRVVPEEKIEMLKQQANTFMQRTPMQNMQNIGAGMPTMQKPF